MKKNKFILFIILALIVWGASLLLDYLGSFEPVEQTVTFWRYRYRVKRNPLPPTIDGTPLVMVALDDNSMDIINSSGKSGMISREIHARVIDSLTRRGARLIMTDFYYPYDSDDPVADRALVSAVKKARNVVIGTRFEDVQELDPLTMDLVSQRTVLPPYSRLDRVAAGTGLLNVDTRYANIGGVFHEALLGLKIGTVFHPSLVVSAANKLNILQGSVDGHLQLLGNNRSVPSDERVWETAGDSQVSGISARLDFVNPFDEQGRITAQEGFRYVSYADCLSDSYWAEGLRFLKEGAVVEAREAFKKETEYSNNPNDSAGLLVKLIDSMGASLCDYIQVSDVVSSPFRKALLALLQGEERNKPIQLGEQLAGEKSVVDGAVCLLAPWSETFGDLVLTPLGRMRGACLHANLMLTLASGRMLYVLTGTKVGFLEPFLLLLLLILIAWLLTWTDLRIAATVAVLIPICFFLASFEIFSNWGLILRTSTPVTALGFLVFIGTVARFIIEQKDRRRIKRLFSRYVAPNVVSEILRNADMLNMKGKKVEATVLFLDICGFTSFSESHAPEEVFKKLNTYLDMIVAAILESGGTLDKFIGDAVMAVFGAPIPMKDHPEKAVRCALDIRDRLDRYNRSLGADEAPFRIRIGLNSGFCVAGNVGTDARSEYTVIGDTVNLASRLESSASPQEIIISETTYSFLVGVFKIEERPPIKLKGKSQPQKTFKVLG